jgi:hypothetical protein
MGLSMTDQSEFDALVERATRALCESWFYCKIGTPDGNEEWRRKQVQYRKQAKAPLAAIGLAPDTVIAPKEATKEMLYAALRSDAYWSTNAIHIIERSYRSMLAARPKTEDSDD